ncbi:cytochrome c family protein [Sphingomonas koreensis]|nr:cytochrome c family protein [Sphingomonas koreensis]
MIRGGTIAFGIAISALALTACSKKPSADDQTASTAAQDAANDAAAAAAPAATTPAAAPAPAADNTDTISGVKYASYTGDAAAGKTDFITCTTCHSIDAGVNKIGPSLHGVVGRKAGIIPGYSYSDANKNSGITWTPEKLFQYLENPQRVVPGTKMTFVGFPDPQKRADVIAYLKQNS